MSDEKASAWTDEERVAMAAQKRVDSKDAYEPCHACDGSGFMRLRTSDAYPGCGHPEVKPGCMTCDPRPAEAPIPNGEHIARVMMMTNGDPTWDLSDNDRLAIQHVLDRMRIAEAEVRRRERDQPGPLPVRSTLGVPDWFLHSLAGVLRYPLDSSAETLLLAADRLWVQQTSGDGATESLQTEASVTTTTPAGGPGEAGTTSSTPNACKTSGEPGGGVVASVAPSSPLPVREPEEAGATFTFTEPNACSECGNDAPFEEWRCHLHRCGTTVRAARSSGAERDESTPEEKAFWDGVHKSAELVKGQPAWTGAGINLNPKNFETYAPDAQTVPRDKHDAALITCAVAGQQCHRMCEAVRAYLTARKGQGPETYDVALARMVRTLAEIDAAVKVST
jgi:hypothetical protein